MQQATQRRRTGRPAPARPPNNLPTIVFGVDFGTTYSGVAWAVSSKPDQVNLISNWQSFHSNNSDKEKCPSVIVYLESGEVSHWGFDAPPDMLPLKWFKLCLLDEEDLPPHVRDCGQIKATRMLLTKLNKHATDVIADYLRELWAHCIENVERDLGQGLVEAAGFKVVFTIPAIWPAYAQARMQLAIEKAGILDPRAAGETTLTFVTEPEAATLATMADMSGRAAMKPNEHFIVCDAGGGTVDIITYKVAQSSPLTIRESIQGDGGLCGAVFLDERFLSLLRKRLPRSSLNKLGNTGISRMMNREWENGIKAEFLNTGQKWSLHVPYGGTVEDNFQSPEVVVTSDEILEVFQPVVHEITALVSDQITSLKAKCNRRPKFVVLVGGFGRSRFLHKCISAAAKDQIEILQSSGARPWTAICRGAVIRGLSESTCGDEVGFAVDSRVSRAHYGTVFNVVPWEAGLHSPKDREWCPVNQEYWAKDQTQWFLRMGEHVKKSKPVIHSFYQEMSGPYDEIVTELVYSTAADPPTRWDENVKSLCVIRWSKTPAFETLPAWVNPKGERFRTVHYDIKMIANGVSLDFEIFHEGTIVASKNVAVEFDPSGSLFRPRARQGADNGNDSDSDYQADEV